MQTTNGRGTFSLSQLLHCQHVAQAKLWVWTGVWFRCRLQVCNDLDRFMDWFEQQRHVGRICGLAAAVQSRCAGLGLLLWRWQEERCVCVCVLIPGHVLVDTLKAALRVVLANIWQVEIKIMSAVRGVCSWNLDTLQEQNHPVRIQTHTHNISPQPTLNLYIIYLHLSFIQSDLHTSTIN